MTGHDVVVVGGRVAGASTALLLARAGLRVALLDRSPYASDTVSTHGLMRGGVLQLARWGVLDDVVASGTPPVRRTTFHYADADPVTVTIRIGPGVDALYAPRRHLLDRLLVDAAARAGAEVLHDTTVVGLRRDDPHDPERVTGVRAVDGRGHRRHLAARITVGADGLRSTVAREAGAPVVLQGRHAGGTLYRYVPGLRADGYEWAFAHGAAAGLIPTNDGETCVFVSTTPARLRALRRDGAEAAFSALLGVAGPALAPRVADAPRGGRLHGWVGVPGFVRRSWGPGWALVGDAGYFKDPITAHGITDALRDAELLADAIVAGLAGGIDEGDALAGYQATRARLSGMLREVTERIAGYDWDTLTVSGLLRTLSAAMSDEVEHLEALPERRVGTGFHGFVRPDIARTAG